MISFARYDAPWGPLLLVSDGPRLTEIRLNPEKSDAPSPDDGILAATARWLDQYFAGSPIPPQNIPISPKGTPFQQLVWRQLLEIPWGETRSYGALAVQTARLLGKPRMSAQAIGGAVGRNPIAVLIPCHRVLGADGSLTGFSGGLEIKRWLLAHEGILPPDHLQAP